MKEQHLDRPKRRRFLQDMVALGSTTALLAVTGSAQATVETSVAETKPGAKSGGYHLTPHIDDYYRTLRF